MVDERPERVPGLRTKFLNDGVPTDRVARLSVTLGLPDGRDTSGLRLLIPQCRQLLIIAISNIQTTGVGCGKVYGRPLDSLNPTRIKTLLITGFHPTDDILADDDALDLYIRQTVGTARHVSGTCKMGPDSDPIAVVDQYCRVKGVQRLSVVDASVKPRITRSGGSHATVVMIGERVVDWIASA